MKGERALPEPVVEGFRGQFAALTGNPPFPWQTALFERFVAGDFPAVCDIPTGLGKTSIMALWLLALAQAPVVVPRRLVYIVNRRTVVDQATGEAIDLRTRLDSVPMIHDRLRELGSLRHKDALAISTLRGQFADNGEWRLDAARPAIVVGTVDMIGSRLLFSGYGAGFKSKPLHAGLLGQDSLILHDEAHLEPAFQALLERIQAEQGRCRQLRPFRVVALSATTRDASDRPVAQRFTLTDEDYNNRVVRQRVEAVKQLTLHEVESDKTASQRIAELAAAHQDAGSAVLVFARTLEAVAAVQKELEKTKRPVVLLTGTLRGKERDRLAEGLVFSRFRKNAPPGETVYLVCTAAGEVGVDISAQHLVCDVSTLESMTQRFGRVNRYGLSRDSRIDAVYPQKWNDKDGLTPRRQATLELLSRLDGAANPAALAKLMSGLTVDERNAAFLPTPAILTATDIHFDAWALTSIRSSLLTTPDIEPFLHGLEGWELPETSVAWRRDVELLHEQGLEPEEIAELLDDYPLKPNEILRDRTFRVTKELEKAARRMPDAPVWIIDRRGVLATGALREFVETRDLAGCTVLLPPSAGGLAEGILNGAAKYDERTPEIYSVEDEWGEADGIRRRQRVWDEAPAPREMRLIRTVDIVLSLGDEADDAPSRRQWRWYVCPESADDDGSQSGRNPQGLSHHLAVAADYAGAMANSLGLAPDGIEARAAIFAAARHDLGKRRRVWQRSIRNDAYDANDPETALAKGGGAMMSRALSGYRHEFGSLHDVMDLDPIELEALSPEARELALHLIATHHGRARPHFTNDEAHDPERSDEQSATIALQAPGRFARLQRQYGWWQLAWLENLLRCADWLASAQPNPTNESEAPHEPT